MISDPRNVFGESEPVNWEVLDYVIELPVRPKAGLEREMKLPKLLSFRQTPFFRVLLPRYSHQNHIF